MTVSISGCNAGANACILFTTTVLGVLPAEVLSLVHVAADSPFFSDTTPRFVLSDLLGANSVAAVVAEDRTFCGIGLASEGLNFGRSLSVGTDDDEVTIAVSGDEADDIFSSFDAARRPRINDFQRILTASSVRPCR